LREAEAASLTQSTSFNLENVKAIFFYLKKLRQEIITLHIKLITL